MNDKANAAIVAASGFSPAFQVDMTFCDTVDVEADYARGFSGSRETPAEPGGYFPTKVYWRGIDITSVLEPHEWDELTEKVNAK